MTEEEWNTSTDPQAMLRGSPEKGSDRKLRLFSCACCRHVPHLMPDIRSHSALNVAERVADGLADDREWDITISMFRRLPPITPNGPWPLMPSWRRSAALRSPRLRFILQPNRNDDT